MSLSLLTFLLFLSVEFIVYFSNVFEFQITLPKKFISRHLPFVTLVSLCVFRSPSRYCTESNERTQIESQWMLCKLGEWEGSRGPDVRSIVLKCDRNTYYALSSGARVAGAMSDKRTEAVPEKAVMKDEPFVPTIEY